MAHSDSDRRSILKSLLIVLVGQVGCITLLVILLSVRAGLWLDAQFQSKPIYTLILLGAGIPVSVLLMLVVARRTLAKLTERHGSEQNDQS
jgi:hypothetical protein